MNSCNTVFPSDMVCLRNICINTMHKGNDDDDDDDDDDNNNNNNNNNNNMRGKRKLTAVKILKQVSLVLLV